MLITKFVDVKFSTKTFKHYKELGYDVKKNTTITVPIEHLTKGSNTIIELKCDYCGETINKTYNRYLKDKEKFNNKDCCKKCSYKKAKETCLEKFGVEHCLQNEKCKEKFINTMMERYGVEYYPQADKYIEKTTATNLKKRNVKHHTQTQEWKDDMSEFWSGLSNDERIEINKKCEQTCLEKYGTNSPMGNYEIQEKKKQTCLEKYGFEHASQYPEIKEKVIQTVLNKGFIPISKPQIEVYEMIKLLFGEENVILNHPFDYYVLDTALFTNKLKIDIEYDGWYWHKDRKEKDKKRNKYLINYGWKVLRIKSREDLPTIDEVKKSLDILINTDEIYQEIVLDDWVEREDIA